MDRSQRSRAGLLIGRPGGGRERLPPGSATSTPAAAAPGPTPDDPVYFDFIFNAENVKLEADIDSLIESMKIINSTENEIFYIFLKNLKQYNRKFSLLKSLLDEYSTGDSFYTTLSEEFIDIQYTNSQKLIDLIERLPGSVASAVIKMNLLPLIHPSIRGSALFQFYKDHYFDLVSFTDERLINSRVYDTKIIEYLGFFKNPELNTQEQEQAYIPGVDNIMDKASFNPVIYDYVLNFLIDGFDKLKSELVLVHIADNYIEGGCETNNKKLLEKRLEGYKKMAIGEKVPDIIMLDENGKQVRLYELKNDYILVLFWASWCPHCTNMMPRLKKWYETRSINLQVFAVSIDSSRFAWEEHLMLNNFPWINTCTFAGWNDKAARDYNLYATPTMFLLDRSRKIIAKPMTFREFRKEVDKL
ncbi:Thiol-disulfide oxidoreductase [sediment metagenome]|uniref:Thiol-disulfide oxidoreductase n=1 Tax=sediment metagenome TaxID=749907 RepID=D9PFH7_9ZZZZ